MKRLGLDYEKVWVLNPSVVYASLTGYGQQGRRALLPGHDVNYQAASGALALSGLPDGRPQHVFGLQVADLCGAMYGLSSVMTALFQRERTGIGQHLDIAITDCLTHWINPRMGAFQAHGITDLRAQRQDALDKPAYGVFRTADDRDITIGALEDHFWKSLTQVLDLAPFDTEEYLVYEARAQRAGEIRELMARRVAAWNCAQLEQALLVADVPVLVVEAPADVLESAELAERGLRTEGADGPLIRFPVRLAGMDTVQLSVLPRVYAGGSASVAEPLQP
jgi:crotonobetainyl-CoA:carnitine CoA-transferase CaiB-like acyl-CoA transferase